MRFIPEIKKIKLCLFSILTVTSWACQEPLRLNYLVGKLARGLDKERKKKMFAFNILMSEDKFSIQPYKKNSFSTYIT